MNKLKKSSTDRVIAGICGGFAEYLSVDATLVRLIWVFFTIFGGAGILAYIIAFFLLPDSKNKSKEIVFEKTQIQWIVVIFIVIGVLLIKHLSFLIAAWNTFFGAGINTLFAFLLLGYGVLYYSNLQKSEEMKKLHVSKRNKKLLGVCAGISEFIDLDVTIIRFLWVLWTFLSGGLGVFVYLIMAWLLPGDEG